VVNRGEIVIRAFEDGSRPTVRRSPFIVRRSPLGFGVWSSEFGVRGAGAQQAVFNRTRPRRRARARRTDLVRSLEPIVLVLTVHRSPFTVRSSRMNRVATTPVSP